MTQDDYELRYCRLLADVRAARDKIGDTPCRSAGIVAVTQLDQVLKHHTVAPGRPELTSSLPGRLRPGE